MTAENIKQLFWEHCELYEEYSKDGSCRKSLVMTEKGFGVALNKAIDEACKKQREICADQFTTEKDFIYDLGTFKNDISEDGKFNENEFNKMLDFIYKFIKLAPSPLDEVK